jgi:hypothetical protein
MTDRLMCGFDEIRRGVLHGEFAHSLRNNSPMLSIQEIATILEDFDWTRSGFGSAGIRAFAGSGFRL